MSDEGYNIYVMITEWRKEKEILIHVSVNDLDGNICVFDVKSREAAKAMANALKDAIEENTTEIVEIKEDSAIFYESLLPKFDS